MPSDRKLTVAGLADQILDLFVLSMPAIAHQGMYLLISNQIVFAVGIGTEVILRADCLFPATPAFLLTPGLRCVCTNW